MNRRVASGFRSARRLVRLLEQLAAKMRLPALMCSLERLPATRCVPAPVRLPERTPVL